jgi:hypothetical protein
MPHSDDEASYGSVHEYTSDEENEPEDTLHDRQSEAPYGSVHEYTSDEENEPEDTLHDRKQRLLALLTEMESLIEKM